MAPADMTFHIPSDREINIPLARMPNAITIPIALPLHEKRRHIAELRRIPLCIDADTLILPPVRHTLLPRLPQIFRPADALVVGEIAADGEGVAVHEGEIAVRSSLAVERAFEFGVAPLRIGFGADEHGAALLVGGHADAFGPVAELAVAGPRGVGRV